MNILQMALRDESARDVAIEGDGMGSLYDFEIRENQASRGGLGRGEGGEGRDGGWE